MQRSLIIAAAVGWLTIGVVSAPAVATADGAVQHANRVKNSRPDPLALALVRHFAGLDRTPSEGLIGRQAGRAHSAAGRPITPPSWLQHARRTIRTCFTPAGFAEKWAHPLASIQPRVMAAEGGGLHPSTWHRLTCGGRIDGALELDVLRPGKLDRVLLKMAWSCGDRDVDLVVLATTQGSMLEAFGITAPRIKGAEKVRAARLMPGHIPLVRLPGNHFAAQVQWHRAVVVRHDRLPRLQRFGPAKSDVQRRALWVFSPAGRPLFSLFGPDARPATRIGVADSTNPDRSATTLTQAMANGTKRSWRIDAKGRIVVLGTGR